MNQTDKKAIKSAVEALQVLSPILAKVVAEVKERETIERVLNQVQELEPTIEDIMYKFVDKRDDMTDRQRDTDKGQMIEEVSDSLERAYDALREAGAYLEDVLNRRD